MNSKVKICGFCNTPIAYPRGIDNYKSPTSIAKYIWPVPHSTNPIVGKTACAKCATEQEELQLKLGLILIAEAFVLPAHIIE